MKQVSPGSINKKKLIWKALLYLLAVILTGGMGLIVIFLGWFIPYLYKREYKSAFMQSLFSWTRLFTLASICCLSLPQSALATESTPSMIYNDAGKPIALIGAVHFHGASAGCSSHFGKFVVDEVAYEDASDIVGGVRVLPVGGKRDPDAPSQLIRLSLLDDLPQKDMQWLSTLVRTGATVLIAYERCGAGGFANVRDLYKADALSW